VSDPDHDHDDDGPADAAARVCPACGHRGLEPGYLEDQGDSSMGFIRWIAGPIVLGRVGRAKVDRHRERFRVEALRCPACRHLSLYTTRRA